MTIVVPGTGGTIKSTTAEAQLLEIINFIRINEKILAKNPTNKIGVTGSCSLATSFFNGSFDIDCTRSLTSGGQPLITAVNYFTGVDFVCGTTGTFKSTNPIAYFYEVMTFLEFGEALQVGDSPKNYVSSTLTGDDNRIVGTINTPIVWSIESDGAIKIQAVPYLT